MFHRCGACPACHISSLAALAAFALADSFGFTGCGTFFGGGGFGAGGFGAGGAGGFACASSPWNWDWNSCAEALGILDRLNLDASWKLDVR